MTTNNSNTSANAFSYDKQILRKDILNKRKNLSDEEIENTSKLLCEKIINHAKYNEANIILAYMAQDGEIDLNNLMGDAIKNNKKVYIPKVLGKHNMEFFRYTNKDDLEISNFGILEPKEKEPLQISETDQILVIVPDSYLAKLQDSESSIYTLAPCYNFQLINSIKSEDLDIPVMEVISL